MAKITKDQKSQLLLEQKFQSLLKSKKQLQISSLSFDKFTNYKYEEFKSIEECYDKGSYSFYCYCLCKWGFPPYDTYLLRISDIEMIDGRNFTFVCPAYRIEEDMAKKRVLIEPNKLGLTAGKLSIDLPESEIKLDFSNSVYDARLKRRVPIIEGALTKEKATKEKKEPVKKEKIEDERINNTDIQVEGKLHSSHFLPPLICTRLWVLSRGTSIGWAWYSRLIEGSKTKYEYYCRPVEVETGYEQYERGGDFITYAYLKKDFQELDIPELSHINLIELAKGFETKQVDSIQVVIDAILCQNT